jgi:hypothetical protein
VGTPVSRDLVPGAAACSPAAQAARLGESAEVEFDGVAVAAGQLHGRGDSEAAVFPGEAQQRLVERRERGHEPLPLHLALEHLDLLGQAAKEEGEPLAQPLLPLLERGLGPPQRPVYSSLFSSMTRSSELYGAYS